MRTTTPLFAIAMSVLVGCVHARTEGPFDLASLLPVASGLPANTQLVEVTKDAPFPFGMTTNPTISSDPAFVSAFVEQLFGDPLKPESVSEALFACYKESKEIGIFAFRFTDPSVAETALQMLPQKERYFRIRKGNIVVFVWHDGVSQPVFESFHRHVTAVLRRSEPA